MLTKLEKQILGLVQEPLKICRRPFAVIARRAGCTTQQCLEIISGLKAKGYIRRMGAVVNYMALGRTAALVAASVPRRRLNKVIPEVNRLEGVSHHYLRKHAFNLWFTIQDTSQRKIQNVLRQLTKTTGAVFYPLPAIRVFKLDARFCPQGPSEKDFKAGPYRAPDSSSVKVSLTKAEKKVLKLLQGDFPITERPFDVLAEKSGMDNFIESVRRLVAKKVVRRIGAVAAYRRLGYQANVMACFTLADDHIESAAVWLSARPAVSHCYQRKTFGGWSYNVFAMIHAGKPGDIEHFVNQFVRKFEISQWVLLPTEKELKKQTVIYQG